VTVGGRGDDLRDASGVESAESGTSGIETSGIEISGIEISGIEISGVAISSGECPEDDGSSGELQRYSKFLKETSVSSTM
jgi:hypothetical protein